MYVSNHILIYWSTLLFAAQAEPTTNEPVDTMNLEAVAISVPKKEEEADEVQSQEVSSW